jgi:hypothetical protein
MLAEGIDCKAVKRLGQCPTARELVGNIEGDSFIVSIRGRPCAPQCPAVVVADDLESCK